MTSVAHRQIGRLAAPEVDEVARGRVDLVLATGSFVGPTDDDLSTVAATVADMEGWLRLTRERLSSDTSFA
jgi:hypothetical protein